MPIPTCPAHLLPKPRRGAAYEAWRRFELECWLWQTFPQHKAAWAAWQRAYATIPMGALVPEWVQDLQRRAWDLGEQGL